MYTLVLVVIVTLFIFEIIEFVKNMIENRKNNHETPLRRPLGLIAFGLIMALAVIVLGQEENPWNVLQLLAVVGFAIFICSLSLNVWAEGRIDAASNRFHHERPYSAEDARQYRKSMERYILLVNFSLMGMIWTGLAFIVYFSLILSYEGIPLVFILIGLLILAVILVFIGS